MAHLKNNPQNYPFALPLTQWAAVRKWRSEMSVAPQEWIQLLSSLSFPRLAIQGQWPTRFFSILFFGPAMKLLPSATVASPHSEIRYFVKICSNWKFDDKYSFALLTIPTRFLFGNHQWTWSRSVTKSQNLDFGLQHTLSFILTRYLEITRGQTYLNKDHSDLCNSSKEPIGEH